MHWPKTAYLFTQKKGCRASLTKEEKGPQLSFVGPSRTGKGFTMMDYTVVYSVGEGVEHTGMGSIVSVWGCFPNSLN